MNECKIRSHSGSRHHFKIRTAARARRRCVPGVGQGGHDLPQTAGKVALDGTVPAGLVAQKEGGGRRRRRGAEEAPCCFCRHLRRLRIFVICNPIYKVWRRVGNRGNAGRRARVAARHVCRAPGREGACGGQASRRKPEAPAEAGVVEG